MVHPTGRTIADDEPTTRKCRALTVNSPRIASSDGGRWSTASFFFVTVNAGVYVFLAVAIVPYWQTLSGPEVQLWFATHFGRFSWMMIPVHLLAMGTTVVAFRAARRSESAFSRAWWVVLIGLFASQGFNFTVFGAVLNPDLSSQALGDAEALASLDTWGRLHLIRTTLVVIAAGALGGLVSRGSTS